MQTTAEIWIDHQKAVITTTSALGQTTSEIRANPRSKRLRLEESHRMPSPGQTIATTVEATNGEQLGYLNSFYSEVITAIGGAMTVLVFGPGGAKVELGRQLQLIPVTVRVHSMRQNGEMTDRQISDRARDHFYN